MDKGNTFVGLDVHKETIAVAVAEGDGGAPRWLGTIPNRPEAVARLVRKVPRMVLRLEKTASPRYISPEIQTL